MSGSIIILIASTAIALVSIMFFKIGKDSQKHSH